MAERLFLLALLSAHLLLARGVYRWVHSRPVGTVGNFSAEPDDTESKLAFSKKLPLSSLSAYDLAFIPGLSERIALEILEHREELLPQSKRSAMRASPDPLLSIHGIGPKTAPKIRKYIELK